MSFETILSGVSIFVTLLLGLLVARNAFRTNRTAEKKLTVEEQQAVDDREDVISRRRKEELDRLYARVDEMEADIEALKADRTAQKAVIREQAHEIIVLQAQAALAEKRESLLYQHTRDMRNHILAGKAPPPPTMPVELVAWYEEFELSEKGLIGGA